MKKCIEWTKAYVAKMGFKIIEEDEVYLAFNYQMNTVHVVGSQEDEHFVMVMLANFAEVTPENQNAVWQRCNQVNQDAKQVKLYASEERIISAAEFYFNESQDFEFQLKMALKSVIAGKVMYRKLED